MNIPKPIYTLVMRGWSSFEEDESNSVFVYAGDEVLMHGNIDEGITVSIVRDGGTEEEYQVHRITIEGPE